jgi:hypothetical protein
MKRWYLLLTLLAVVLTLTIDLTGAGAVDAQEPVTIQGRVVNGTQGATVAPGQAVFLHTFQQGDGVVSSVEATTDDAGRFRFDNVTPTGDIGYALTTDYAGMRYSKLIGPEDLAGPVEFLVYETTQDLSVINVERQALVITGVNEQEQLIEAAEFVSLSNESDRTLLPDLSNVGQGRFSFLRFSLPRGATDFDIQANLVGGEVIPVGTGFGLTSPVVPGNHNLSFSFKFPYQGETFSYQQNLLQGAEVFQVLVPQRLGQIQVARLESMPPLDVEGSVYRVWEGRDFAPGQGLLVELTNLPQPSLLARFGRLATSGSFWHMAIPISLGAVLAVVLLYAGIRPTRLATTLGMVTGPTHPNGDLVHREELVQAIASLDERFQLGWLPEDQYQAQRVQLKARLVEISAPGTDEVEKD